MPRSSESHCIVLSAPKAAKSRKDGTAFPVEVRLGAIEQDGEKRILASARDITERLEAEREVRESEERFRGLSGATFEGILISNNGEVVEANAAFASMFGYDDPSEVIGRPVLDFVAEESVDTIQEHIYQPSDEVYKAVGARKDGSTLDLEIRGRSSSYRDRDVRIAAVRDITERKKIDETNRRLAGIVESTDDAIISRTLDGTITSWNPGAEQLYGYSAEEVIGETLWNLYSPDRLKDRREISERTKRGESLKNYETVHEAKDGRRIDVSLTVTSIRDTEGNAVGASAIVRDITERKRAEEHQARLASFPELNPALVIEMDFSGEITYSNPAALETLPDLDELGNEHPILAGIKSAADGLSDNQNIMREVEVGGSHYQRNISRVSEVERIRIYIVDVTERKQAEREILETSTRLSTLIEREPAGGHPVGGRYAPHPARKPRFL